VSETVDTAAGRPGAPAPEPSLPGVEVRPARSDEAGAVARAVHELLLELGGSPSSLTAMEDAARTLLTSPVAGIALVAEVENELVGILAASWQVAIHVPGSYALIQDLWVHPAWRSRTIGRDLVAALVEAARAKGMERVEVGLPRERFAGFPATEAFYLGNGFEHLGPRMRRVLG
jgi:GNAT superfamily N-acetyltransferase